MFGFNVVLCQISDFSSTFRYITKWGIRVCMFVCFSDFRVLLLLLLLDRLNIYQNL